MDKVRELKEVDIKEEELRKLTPRQAAQLLVEKKVLTEVQEKELVVRGGVKRFGELIGRGTITTNIRTGEIVKKITKKRFLEVEIRESREERDSTIAHELIHLLHPNWEEKRVEKEEVNFFRRDPFDDIIGFRTTPKQQPFLQLGEKPFFIRQIKKKGVVSRFRFPMTFTNKG